MKCTRNTKNIDWLKEVSNSVSDDNRVDVVIPVGHGDIGDGGEELGVSSVTRA